LLYTPNILTLGVSIYSYLQ